MPAAPPARAISRALMHCWNSADPTLRSTRRPILSRMPARRVRSATSKASAMATPTASVDSVTKAALGMTRS
ncbi:hypothetical protein ACFSZS_12925 [Seohaeicola zhoushanensis]